MLAQTSARRLGISFNSFERPIIHSFEPNRRAFDELRQRCSAIEGVRLNNFGLGAEVGTLEFIENTYSELELFSGAGR